VYVCVYVDNQDNGTLYNDTQKNDTRQKMTSSKMINSKMTNSKMTPSKLTLHNGIYLINAVKICHITLGWRGLPGRKCCHVEAMLKNMTPDAYVKVNVKYD
jgi:hypothetical protein